MIKHSFKSFVKFNISFMKMIAQILAIALLISCTSTEKGQKKGESTISPPSSHMGKLDTATFAGGCFWCIEASFEPFEGVIAAVSGYAGGKKSTANYKMVSYGSTKHAESVQVYYDPEVISYGTLLDIFFTAHDPTQLNRQGPDVGTQYRSEIFYHNGQQQQLAHAKIKELGITYTDPIVTKLTPYEAFYPAEDYHQNYEKNHPYDRYIMNVSRPKIDRVKKKFKSLLKEGEQ